MSKKIKKNLSFEKSIEMASLPLLSENDILSAKKRVWNQINAKITEEENIAIKEEVKVRKPWFFNFKFYGYSMATLTLCLLIVIGSFSFYSQYLQNTKEKTTNINSYDKTKVAVQGVQALAASRFQELNGVTFEQFKAALTEEKPVIQTNNINEATPTNIIKIDQEKGNQIINSSQIKDIPTFISKKKLQIFDNELFKKSDIYSDNYLNIKSNSNLIITTTTRPNYFKQILTSNTEIINFRNETPMFSLNFLGGKYAIKQIYDENKVQIAGIGSDGSQIFNPDTKVLQEILTNPDANLTGRAEGTLEAIISDKNSDAKFIYTLDQNTLAIQKQEFWIGEKLVYTLIALENKQIKDGQNSIDMDFSSSELDEKKVEIKEIKSDLDFSNFELVKSNFTEFSKLFDILKTSDDESRVNDAGYELYDFTSAKNKAYKDYLLLSQTKDYNLNFDDSKKILELDQNVLAIQKVGNYNIKIYQNNPFENTNDFIKVEAKINSKRIDDIFTKTEGNLGSKLKQTWILPIKNLTYIINFEVDFSTSNTNYNPLKTFEFNTIDTDFAIRIDKYIEEKNEAKPSLKEVKLTELSKENQILVQNYSKNKKLNIENIYQFNKTSKNTKCDDFYLKFFDQNYLNCLTEKNDGLILNLKDQTSSNTIIFYIIKSNVEKKYLDILEKNNYKVEKNGEQYLVLVKM